MAASYNDNTIQYGTHDLNIIYPNSVSMGVFVCDNITINRPTKVIQRTDNLGEPTGSVGVPDFVNGSGTMQLANASSVEPAAGCTFTENFQVGVAETFFIHSVGLATTKDGEKKVPFSFIKKYGA